MDVRIRRASRWVAVIQCGLVPLICAAVVSRAAAQAPQAWTIAFKSTIDSGGGTPISTGVRFRVSGSKVRMEVTLMPGALAAASAEMAGMYMLSTDGDSGMTTVIPAQQMAMTMSQPGAQMIDYFRQHIKGSDMKIEKTEDLGPGETMLGHPTRHYRITQSSTTTVTLHDQSCERRQTTVTDVSMAPDIDATGVLLVVARKFSALSADPNQNPFNMQVPGMPKGTAMRTVTTVSTPTDPQSKVQTTFELTEFSNAPLDSSLFVVPAGFQTMDMRAMAAMPPASMEAVMEGTLTRMMQGSCAPKKAP